MEKIETISITVRLPKELLEWIDAKVDGIDYRNRTHLITKALYEFKEKTR